VLLAQVWTQVLFFIFKKFLATTDFSFQTHFLQFVWILNNNLLYDSHLFEQVVEIWWFFFLKYKLGPFFTKIIDMWQNHIFRFKKWGIFPWEKRGKKNGPKQHVFYFLCRIIANLVKIVQRVYFWKCFCKSHHILRRKSYIQVKPLVLTKFSNFGEDSEVSKISQSYFLARRPLKFYMKRNKSVLKLCDL